MSRTTRVLFFIGGLLLLSQHDAGARAATPGLSSGAAPSATTAATAADREPGVILAASESQADKKRKQCEALNLCRADFTRCFDRIKRDPKKNWDNDANECAHPYRACIKKNFKTFEMWFTRMFWPYPLDCK